jgi:hypothetical protein
MYCSLVSVPLDMNFTRNVGFCLACPPVQRCWGQIRRFCSGVPGEQAGVVLTTLRMQSFGLCAPAHYTTRLTHSPGTMHNQCQPVVLNLGPVALGAG